MTEFAQVIHQNSLDTEWYTPVPIIKAARCIMGGIDLDPATSEIANSRPGVQIRRYYTTATNGLTRPWFGNVWMNHPFGRFERACGDQCQKKACAKRGYHLTEDLPGNEQWIAHLVGAWQDGAVEQACCICFGAVNAAWFHPLLDFPQFFFLGRVGYERPDGTIADGVLKDSVFTWLPHKRLWTRSRWEEAARMSQYLWAYGYEGKAK